MENQNEFWIFKPARKKVEYPIHFKLWDHYKVEGKKVSLNETTLLRKFTRIKSVERFAAIHTSKIRRSSQINSNADLLKSIISREFVISRPSDNRISKQFIHAKSLIDAKEFIRIPTKIDKKSIMLLNNRFWK